MKLPVAFGVKQPPVLRAIGTAMRPVNERGVVPTRPLSDFLVAHRAKSLLFPPQTAPFPPPLQGGCHRNAQTLLKGDFPGRILRISLRDELAVSLQGRGGRQGKPVLHGLPVCVSSLAEETPMVVAHRAKVLLFDPATRRVRMSSECPTPPRLEEGVISLRKGLPYLGEGLPYLGEGLPAGNMTLRVGPSPDFGRQWDDQGIGRRLFVGLDKPAEVSKKRLHVRFGGLGSAFALELA